MSFSEWKTVKLGDVANVNQFASAVGKVGRVKERKPMILNQRVGKIEVSDENKYDKI